MDFNKIDISELIFQEFLRINEEIKDLKLKPKYRKTITTNFWLMFYSHEMIISKVCVL